MSVTTTHRPSDGSAPRSDSTVAIVAPSYRGSRRSRPTTFAGIALRTPVLGGHRRRSRCCSSIR